MIGWLVNNWVYVIVPLLVFIAVAVLGLWTRLNIHKVIKRTLQKTGWIQDFIVQTMWHQFLYWFLLLGTYAAIQISVLSPTVKKITGEGVESLFVLSLMWVTVAFSARVIRFYLGKVEARQYLILVVLNVIRAIVAIVGILTILDIWGAPTQAITIFILVGFFIAWLALRNTIDRLFAGFEIIYGDQIKLGHLIELGSGERGYVTQISWSKTIIKSMEGNLIIIPNDKLMANTIINYGFADAENTANDVQRDLAAVKLTKQIDTLTDREREVLVLLGKGATNHEIAQILFVSEHTVKSHIRSILSKLNVRRRQQAAIYAERQGLVAVTETPENNS